ncbi:hypothetical protein GS504_15815 [Rhodococcus hoagii]|nr:hypothetical protein [Prescottella equi]NKR94294.1 hypothetical protein [Prescottella equi]NKS58921.1 hypothetical protein [Prescottella equi]NKS71562.1 hypothetical protein [Prescottella equi]NKS98744.1 hypothetical protein [Prescottella equi]
MTPRRKRVAAAVLAAGALVGLTACAGTDAQGNDTPSLVWPHTVALPDGRTVLCVFEKFDYGGGTSCDWVNAR